MRDNNLLKEFHKRFAKGEQYIEIVREEEIEQQPKSYFWQEQAVYNKIAPIIDMVKAEYPKVTEDELYGENGLVERLVSLQRTYNSIKNRRIEALNRLSMGVMVCEDGSVDLDNLEEEGLAPGKVLIYRQGSTPPYLLKQYPNFFTVFEEEEKRVLGEIMETAEIWIKFNLEA